MPEIDAPVGKGQQNDTSDVLVVRLLLNKFLLLGLIDDDKGDTVWPISPFGDVDASMDEAIRAFQRQVCGFKPDGVISPGKTTINKLNGPVSAASASSKKKSGGGGVRSVTDADRDKLAELALDLAKQGCHYITGGYGATPGASDGHPNRPNNAKVVPASFDSSSAAILAAKVGKKVCRGRYKQSGVGGKKSTDKALLKRYLGWLERLDSAGVAARHWMGLHTFERFEADADGAATIAGLPSLIAQANAYTEWFKRRAVKPDVFPRESGGITVFGEDCSKRRHFDCIGFVNYCIAQAWGKPTWQVGYDTYRYSPGKVYGKSLSLSKSGLKNGDLVLRDGSPFHIGIVCNNGESVANAKGQDVGSGIDAYSSANWDDVCRINSL